MKSAKSRVLFIVLAFVLAISFLMRVGIPATDAGPAVTPTLYAQFWNYLPVVRGVVRGPTATATTPPPTLTPYSTLTPSPTVTDTPTNTPEPSETPTDTATPTETPTDTPEPPTETPTSTPTNEPPANTGDVRITKIFFDGDVPYVESDEYVEIENYDTKVIRLGGWKLHDNGQIHTYTFPIYNMEPGETCRVYTNENHPDWCGFNWGNGSAIWNNSGDEATLKDSSGSIIDTCSYSGSGDTRYCR